MHLDNQSRKTSSKEYRKQKAYKNLIKNKKAQAKVRLPRNKDQLAKILNSNLPKSEKWFWNMYKALGYNEIDDKPNVVLGHYIYDVVNLFKRYVIEVNGSIHDTKEQKDRDILTSSMA